MMGAGGSRLGAGRPAGSGKFGVPTKPIRVPTHLIDDVLRFITENKKACPLYSSSVKAGLPAPVDDDVDEYIDLNQHLIRSSDTTFFLRVTGDSMKDAGIFNGDLLVVDRGIEARHGKIVIAAVNGQLTVKRLKKDKEGTFLLPENPDFPVIPLQENDQIHIWGVVTHAIHNVGR